MLEQTVKATWLWGVKGETADPQLWGGRNLFHPRVKHVTVLLGSGLGANFL